MALDESGRPSFNVLQNYGTSQAPAFYYVSTCWSLQGKDLREETLVARREVLTKLIGKLKEPVREYAQGVSALRLLSVYSRPLGLR